jgi:tetratricopeptide (TPR) repeat protein
MTSDPPDDIESALRPELDEALLALDELARESPEEALRMFDALPEPVQTLPEFQLTLARAHQAAGELEAARDIAAGVLVQDGESSDAHHLMGDLLDDWGDVDQATAHFVHTLSLDRRVFDTLSEGERISEEELTEHVERIGRAMGKARGISFRVQVLPDETEVRQGLDPRALLSTSDESVVVFLANVQAEWGDLKGAEDLGPELEIALSRELTEAFDLSREERDAWGLVSVEIDGAFDGVGDQDG